MDSDVVNATTVVLAGALGIAVPVWIVRFDMRRLDADRLARAWPDASFWIAVVAFGPLCIPVHFWKTRRSLLGLVLGLIWGLAALVTLSAVTQVAAWALE
jgi:hypothetical protein